MKVKCLNMRQSRQKQKKFLFSPFSLSPLQDLAERNTDSLNSTAPSDDFISQTIAAHSDRNVSTGSLPCPAPLSARCLPLDLFPLPCCGPPGCWAMSPLPSEPRPRGEMPALIDQSSQSEPRESGSKETNRRPPALAFLYLID